MATPRILAIMGSGETAPTMTSVHADLLSRLGAPPARAVLLDTPYGFQENAADISARAQQYFRDNVRHPIEVATFRNAGNATALERETMLARLRQADYVFAGPGSPSYAMRQWQDSEVPAVLREKLGSGGCVVFSSAAACTLGRRALPVYEIYKVGEDVHWLPGLDLIAAAGLDAVVVPHFNNAEGGTHDTRYCYMGERRLRLLEELLDAGTMVLGVDEHTALVLDLDAGTATVRGNGVATVRRGDRRRAFPAGTCVAISDLRCEDDGAPAASAGVAASAAVDDPGLAGTPFMDGVTEQETVADAALRASRPEDALAAILALDDHLWSWSSDTLQSDDMDRARSRQRSLLVRLADLAERGARDPAELLAPLVDRLLALRVQLREQRRYADADVLRDLLVDAGIEVNDTRQGTEWSLRGAQPAATGS